MRTSPHSGAIMLAEAQRAAVLAAMGIDVYRLRASAATATPLRIGLDARSGVCVDGGDDDSVGRLLALLPCVLGVAHERVARDAVAGDGAIVVDVSALRGNGADKRKLWQALKPLARQLRAAD